MSKADAQKTRQKRIEKMKKMRESFPELEEVFGFSSSDEHIFMAIFVLTEHSERLNKLTKTLIILTVILAMATIVDIFVRVVP